MMNYSMNWVSKKLFPLSSVPPILPSHQAVSLPVLRKSRDPAPSDAEHTLTMSKYLSSICNGDPWPGYQAFEVFSFRLSILPTPGLPISAYRTKGRFRCCSLTSLGVQSIYFLSLACALHPNCEQRRQWSHNYIFDVSANLQIDAERCTQGLALLGINHGNLSSFRDWYFIENLVNSWWGGLHLLRSFEQMEETFCGVKGIFQHRHMPLTCSTHVTIICNWNSIFLYRKCILSYTELWSIMVFFSSDLVVVIG